MVIRSRWALLVAGLMLMFHRRRVRELCSRTMNRHLLAPALLLLTIPLAAQTPTTAAPQAPVARPRPARSTPPPAGFAQSIVL